MPRKQMIRFCPRRSFISERHCAHRRPCIVPFRPIFNALGLTSGPNFEKGQQYHERKILPYRPSQLYNVVSDVDSYSRFLPYCTSSRVLKRHTVKLTEGRDILKMQGELTVGFMGLTESYISNVECRPYEMVQAVASSEIPLFRGLTTTWQFQPASSASPHPSADIESTLHRSPSGHDGPTLVTLDLEYEFSNPLYAQISTAFFGQVSKMMVEAFERRCLEVYGPGNC